jgi:sugar phosphate isomerase/epimerase
MLGVRAHDYGKQPAIDLLTSIAGDGWKAVQLAFPKAIKGVDAFTDVTPEIIENAKAALFQTGLHVAVLGVYVDPSLVDETERRKNRELLSMALPQVMELGAGCVGTETTSRGDHADISALYRTIEELLPEAERLGVNIGIEPVHYHTLNSPELALKMLNDLASPSLKIIFDPVNLLKPDDIVTQNELWKRCLDCFGEYIVAVHIKGASGEYSEGGVLNGASFANSVVDYDYLFSLIKKLDVPILREGVIPSHAAADIEFLKKYL